ncbi:MAG: VWA domain-containing protein, partial [Pseudomonadota bacterium]
MSDELDRLQNALRDATPAPAPQARDRALAAALAAFDAAAEKNLSGSQAGEVQLRSKDTRPHWAARLFGGLQMPSLSLKPALLGGASLAVLAMAVVIVQDPDLLDPQPKPVTVPTSQQVSQPTLLTDTQPRTDRDTGTDPGTVTVTETDIEEARNAGPVIGGQLVTRREAENTPAPAEPLPAAPLQEAPAPMASARAPDDAVRLRQSLSDMERVQPMMRQPSVAPSPERATRELGLVAPPPPGIVAPDAATQDAPVIAPPDRDRFETRPDNPVKTVAEEPVSTFSIDVDTASYAWMRRSLNQGQMPDPEAVRIEELVNYFTYAYPAPETRDTPFETSVSVMPSPWNADRKLLHIGIQGYALSDADRPDANLVFLIDVSGSMQAADKLPLLVNAFRLLLTELRPTDEVAIVTYAGGAGVALEPTPAAEADAILAVLERLQAGGGTRGEAGLREAYALAEAMMEEGEITRVLLATDGDFNLGLSSDDALTALIEEKRETGVFLSVLGFGEGNYNDALMQRLAQNGNGIAAYIDSLMEARKVLVEGVTGALFPIAKDVKIQIEFNPATIAEYRLIGYETRALNREDFNDDSVDAGEIGAGHSVTAIYEITPVDSPARATDPLRYAQTDAQPAAQPEAQPDNGPENETAAQADPAPDPSTEYAFLKLRYKLPDAEESVLVTRPVTPADEAATQEARFAAAVAGFGQLLKGGRYLGDWSYAEALALARANL